MTTTKLRTVLAPTVIEGVRANPSLRRDIAAAINVHVNTVKNWSVNNDPQLSHEDVLTVIKLYITLPDGEPYTTQVEMGDKHLQVN